MLATEPNIITPLIVGCHCQPHANKAAIIDVTLHIDSIRRFIDIRPLGSLPAIEYRWGHWPE